MRLALRTIRTVSLLACCLAVIAGPAQGITGGVYDASGHPYVALLGNGTHACSGTLISPTILVTAAHCFSGEPSVYGVNSVTGAPIVRAQFQPQGLVLPPSERQNFFGSYYSDPKFCLACGSGIPRADTHDVAVVVFSGLGCPACASVPSGATLGLYGALATPGAVTALPNGAGIDIVGFGVQNFVRGGGPPQPGDVFTRYFARTLLIASSDALSPSFLKLHSNKGGVCFGDSGGPDLIAGTNVVLAENSFGTNSLCDGVSYSYRLDTPAALGFIASVVSTYGSR